MTNSKVYFRKIIRAAMLREDPKGSSGEKLFGNKAVAIATGKDVRLMRGGSGEQKAFGGRFHSACVAFNVTSKHPGGNLLEDIK